MLQTDMPEAFPALLEAIGRQDLLDDERFSTPPARAEHAAALTEVIEAWTNQHDKREVMQAFASRGIPCGAVLDTAEVLKDAHLQERGMIAEIEHPTRGTYTTVGCPLRLSDSPVDLRPAPLLGEQTEQVLTTLAGYTPEEVESFRRDRVL